MSAHGLSGVKNWQQSPYPQPPIPNLNPECKAIAVTGEKELFRGYI